MTKDTYHKEWAGNWCRGGANWIENWLNGTLIKDEPHDDRAMMRNAMTKLNQAGDDIDELEQELKTMKAERDASLEREQALHNEILKMNEKVHECTFHGKDAATCIDYSGQAPCDS